jgi:predicted nucleic acid-binding protein
MRAVDPFLDSNVLVYVLDAGEPRKQAVAKDILRQCLDTGTGSISYQVVQECLNVFSRNVRPPLSEDESLEFLRKFLSPICRSFPDTALFESGLHIRAKYGFSFYDSLIVASASRLGCKQILSEDLQHGQVVEGIRVENPFL